MTSHTHAPRLSRATADSLTVLAWNVRVGRPWSAVRPFLAALLAAHTPDVVVLEECYTIAVSLAAWAAGNGWQTFTGEGTAHHSEARDVVVLVRVSPDLAVVDSGTLVHRFAWSGPDASRPHDGRVFPWVTVVRAGRPWTVLGVHRIAGRRKRANRRPWARETQLLRAFAAGRIAQHPRGAYVEAGDRNQTKATGGWLYARRIGGRYTTAHGVDAVVVVGARARAQALASGGSDHRADLYRLTA